MNVPVTVRFLGGAQHTLGEMQVALELDDALDALLPQLNALFGDRLEGQVGTEYLVTINRQAFELQVRRAQRLEAGDVIAIIAPFMGG